MRPWVFLIRCKSTKSEPLPCRKYSWILCFTLMHLHAPSTTGCSNISHLIPFGVRERSLTVRDPFESLIFIRISHLITVFFYLGVDCRRMTTLWFFKPLDNNIVCLCFRYVCVYLPIVSNAENFFLGFIFSTIRGLVRRFSQSYV